jgi:hypothetical protein
MPLNDAAVFTLSISAVHTATYVLVGLFFHLCDQRHWFPTFKIR